MENIIVKRLAPMSTGPKHHKLCSASQVMDEIKIGEQSIFLPITIRGLM